jgi:hypothetical protein
MSLYFQFARDDLSGEVAFADEIGNDEDFILFNGRPDLTKAGFLFPECTVDTAKVSRGSNLIRMIPARL